MHLCFQPKEFSLEELAGLACGAAIVCYQQNRDLFLCTVIYEDLIQGKEAKTAKLFETLGIPIDQVIVRASEVSEDPNSSHNCFQVPLALTAFAKDSQGKFFGETDGRQTDAIPAKKWARMDELFKSLDIPLKHDIAYEEFVKLFY